MICVLNSCKKDNGPTPFTKNSYPMAVGDWWKYQVTYCFGGYSTDTFTLSVSSMNTSGVYTNYTCDFIQNGGTLVSGFGNFIQSDTSLSFVNTSAYADFSSMPNFHLKFPIAAGQYWQGTFPGDSTLVDAVVSSEDYYGHTYSPCYLTNESYDLPHNFKVESMVLTPKIGLVHQSINFQSDTAVVGGVPGVQVCQSITLIDYSVQQ